MHNENIKKAEARSKELSEVAATKSKNVETYQNSPNYETGQIKQMLKADKATESEHAFTFRKEAAARCTA